MAIESEIKFTVPDRDVFSRIIALREIAGYEARDTGVHAHRDTYFDTAKRLLLHSKVVFRLRERRECAVLTFKAQAAGGGDFYRRIEVEAPVENTVEDVERGNLPDIPPVAAFRKRFGSVALFPALTVENNRRIIILSRRGEPCLEMALDDVTFTGPRGTAQVFELEVESLGDDDSPLPSIGGWLRERFGLAPAGPSKYILGMELVGNTTPE